ncbi:unnamed protein product [Ambrosiozyma monospora]|uniref:Unnamed protein product n=1 Tax=Ambrosiozyma monospora TaxID=43982 RepID=A0A9W6Z440_AMBMO|nr:unnamed protein product [Ambrosiozyma monospora]
MRILKKLILISNTLHKIVFAVITPITFKVAKHYRDEEVFILGCVASLLVFISMMLNIAVHLAKDKIHNIYSIFFTFASLVLITVFTAKTIIGRNDITVNSSDRETVSSGWLWIIWLTIPLTVFMAIAHYCTLKAYTHWKAREEDCNLKCHKEKTSIRFCVFVNVLISVAVLPMSIAIYCGSEHTYEHYRYYLITVVFASINLFMCLGSHWIKWLSFHITLSLLLPAFFGISVFNIMYEARGSTNYKLFITISVLTGIADLVQISLIVFSARESRLQTKDDSFRS